MMEKETEISAEKQGSSELSDVKLKAKYTGIVIKTSLAGALVDIGLETPGVVHISQLQKEPVNRVEDVVQVGQTVDAWVKRIVPKRNRLELTLIQPLDLEWREIKKDMVLKGKVVKLEKFGAFVEIGAERPGLVHISEITHDYISKPSDVISEGEEVEVMVLNVNRQKKQIKLSLKALEVPPAVNNEYEKEEPKSKAKGKKDTVTEEAVPTAMEMALREAMERTKDSDGAPPAPTKKNTTKNDANLDQILDRTLQNKVKTSK
jgi:ribosomal protein S1